jgi:hypothetical protein
MMSAFKKLSPVGLVLASSVIVNLGYLASNLYDIPGILTVIFIPCTLILCIGWFQRNMKRTILLTFGVIIVSASLLQITLSAPVLLGVIQDASYRQVFVYSVFLKVWQFMIMTAFFTLLTALVAGLAFE